LPVVVVGACAASDESMRRMAAETNVTVTNRSLT
jgi:hypothetical protein